MAIHGIVVELSQSVPKWWTDQQSHPASLANVLVSCIVFITSVLAFSSILCEHEIMHFNTGPSKQRGDIADRSIETSQTGSVQVNSSQRIDSHNTDGHTKEA